MRKIFFRSAVVLFALSFPFLSGCGYTQKTVLPTDIKTVYVETVKNTIPIDQIFAYHPGLEMSITKAIIRRLNKDGNVRVVNREDADAILQTNMVRFDQGGLRFTSLESVEAYRLTITVDMRLVNAKNEQIIWQETGFTGETEYFVSDVRSLSRDEAAQRVIDRLARNIVDRIVEDW